MTVVETIEEAERELAAGHNKQAARLLTDAAYHTHDPSIEAKVRELGPSRIHRRSFQALCYLSEEELAALPA